MLRLGPSGAVAAPERAGNAERRLALLLENPSAIAPTRVEAVGATRLLSIGGVGILTVTPADAADNLTSVDALAAQWATAIDAAVGPAARRRLSGAGRFFAEVAASLTAAFSRLGESALRIVPGAFAALAVLALFWLLAAAARRLMRSLFRRLISDLTIENLIQQAAFFTIWALGLVVAVDALGFRPQTVATGLGLTSLAIGFALKDVLSNFVSGLLILATRPFRIGDQVVIGETEGAVERIELRATQVRTYGGRLVLVPNAEVLTSRVTNNTASPIRRIAVRLELGYETPLREALLAGTAAASRAEGVLAEPPASSRLRDLAPGGVLLEVRFWTDSRRSDAVATASNVRRELVEAFRREGIPLPQPELRRLQIESPVAKPAE